MSSFLFKALWTWACVPARAANTVIRVGASAAANATTIADGVAMVPSNQADRWTVLVEPGTYRERVWIKSQMGPVTIKGMGMPEETILIFHCCPGGNGKPGCSNKAFDKACFPQHPGAGMRGVETLLVEADDFVMMNMSVANNACDYNSRIAVQSETIQLLGDRSFFRHMNVLGGQDTIYTGRGGLRQYFLQSYINGSCDSVYGSSSIVFDRCTIAITEDITAMRGAVTNGTKSVYLFVNSSLMKPQKGDRNYPAGRTELGRPWGPLATVVYKDTFMDDHIADYGWGDWNRHCAAALDRGATCRSNSSCWCQNVTYAEYQSHGPGATMKKIKERVKWSLQLSEHAAELYSPVSVMRGWLPSFHSAFDDRLETVVV